VEDTPPLDLCPIKSKQSLCVTLSLLASVGMFSVTTMYEAFIHPGCFAGRTAAVRGPGTIDSDNHYSASANHPAQVTRLAGYSVETK
jgi:hypothetical protein